MQEKDQNICTDRSALTDSVIDGRSREFAKWCRLSTARSIPSITLTAAKPPVRENIVPITCKRTFCNILVFNNLKKVRLHLSKETIYPRPHQSGKTSSHQENQDPIRKIRIQNKSAPQLVLSPRKNVFISTRPIAGRKIYCF